MQKKPYFLLIAGLWSVVATSAFGAVTPRQAVATAINNLRAVPSGVALSHPGYEAMWTSESFEIDARTGPSWSWTLDGVRLGANRVDLSRNIAPVADEQRRIDYDRGAIVERYICKVSSIEQQFVIPRRLGTDGGDLVIAGTVRSSGTFEAAGGQWIWRDARGVIALGNVTVFDAFGRTLPASMTVTGGRIQIAVDGAALAGAVYPVTVDPEIAANDFRISNMGTDGQTTASAGNASVAYNSQNNEFLVVWKGYEGTEVEIWGQRVSAVNGDAIGGDFKISDMGNAPGFDYQADSPDVAYNDDDNEYLVVWSGDDNAAPLIDGDVEIFGQILDAQTGAEIGADDFRISFMGANGATTSTADRPAVAWDRINKRYLVVWAGYDAGIHEFETEVYARLLNNVGVSISADDMRLSNVGTNGDTTRAAKDPDVAFDTNSMKYLVVWNGDHAFDNAYDIYGQLVDSAGAESGTDFRISDLGNSDSETIYEADAPAVSANPTAGEFLVVWHGDDDSTGNGKIEIWGQRVSSTGGEPGTNDFRISVTSGNSNFTARNPAIDYSTAAGEYIVAWQADVSTDEDLEIWMRRVSSAGIVTSPADIRVSDMGPDPSASFFALQPAIAFGGRIALIVWHGDDDIPPLVDDEHEVFGQLYAIGAPVLNPVLDDFSSAQPRIEITQADLDTLPDSINTKNSHEPDHDSIFGRERNLRVSSINVSGGPPGMEVSGGALKWNRPGTSTGAFYVFWDGENESNDFSPTGTPYDLTGGGAYDRFRIDVTSSSSTSLQMLLMVWTDGSNFSQRVFTLPASGPVEILFSDFTPVNAGADFDAARVVYLTTYLNSGTWSAELSSISLSSDTPPFGAPTLVAATATSTSQVSVTWAAVTDATSYEVWRSSLGGAFALATTTSATSFPDAGRSANTTYVYRVRAIGLPGTSAFSANDAATTIVFTDDLLTGVVVKVLHFTQLRTAVAAMRAAAALAVASFTDTLTAQSTTIKRIHVTELRTALDEARGILALPVITYTDSTITAQSTLIKAAHVTQLRAGTQ